jgi:2-polyprenyl-6-methoxyphenol hydroxylase-like FAD-dependent oxidoreductase
MRSLTATEAQTQVVVIGAGPSGLFAAAELARHGVPAGVVEREPAPHRQARATALQPGTLEIWPGWGRRRGAGRVVPSGLRQGLRATPADAAGLAALDAHLDSYLVPART